jgi:hypothetical protein
MDGNVAPMGDAKARDLGRLFYSHYSDANNGSADNAAAFAACVWEIVNETSGTYNISTGSFTVTPSNYAGADTTWGNTANSWLDPNSLGTVQARDLWAIVNTSTQDFAIVIPGSVDGSTVPEPITLLTGFLAVSGFGVYVRRYSKVPPAV